jgi:hypothetical protein
MPKYPRVILTNLTKLFKEDVRGTYYRDPDVDVVFGNKGSSKEVGVNETHDYPLS